MSTPSSVRKTPVDYGVQIRFIKDLHDSGGGAPGPQPRAKPPSASKYGVAVRVQGIAGQPYVVLKDGGEKGDSYGVQLRTHCPPRYSSLPRRREELGGQGEEGGGALRRAQSHAPPPVNRLITGFDGQRGRSPTSHNTQGPSPIITHNPSPPSSVHSSLGRGPGPAPKTTALPANQWASSGRIATVETLPANQRETQVTPDLLLDQGQSAEVTGEEEQIMQTIYAILRDGSSDSDSAIKHKVRVIYHKIQALKSREDSSAEWMREKRELERRLSELETPLREEQRGSAGRSDLVLKLEACLDDNLQLQESLDQNKAELHHTHTELAQLRMDREKAEARGRDLEDQLAELQDEMRRDSTKMQLEACRVELVELVEQRGRVEETLRQRERALGALKGALQDEVTSHDRELEALREQYSTDMEKLRNSMEQVSQSQVGIEAERVRVNASVRSLQQQLEDCRDESSHWMEQFHSARDDLRSTKQQLLQTRLEKEEFEEELKEQQERVTIMKQQIPDARHTQELTTCQDDLRSCRADLKKVQLEVEKCRSEHDKKVMEGISQKKAHQEQEAELRYEIDRLKNQSQRAKEDLVKAQEMNKQLPAPGLLSALEEQLGDARGEAGLLKEKLSLAEQDLESSTERLARVHAEVNVLRDTQLEQEETNTRLRDKLSHLEAQLQTTSTESSEAEQVLQGQVRQGRLELDEARRGASRLGQEQRELSLRLEETERERDTLTLSNTQLEEARRQQERALEKLNKEYDSVCSSSREELQALRAQLEEQRERTRRETQEVQRHGNDTQAELERSQNNLRRLEEEVSRLKKEQLLVCIIDNSHLDKYLLTNLHRHLIN
ncbi:cingulin, partial [Osmerus eperlanus]|uniref:cingulin n=1 Tax=Osmerus eperlanus TaxID=29151 RepID=UPI002E126C95